jgi:adenylate kinase
MSLNIIVMGPQGSGKGTQSALLSKKYAIPAISTGDILRENIKLKTDVGILAEKYISNGMLVPSRLISALLKSRLLESDASNGFILDGYPRSFYQIILLDGILHNLKKQIDVVIEITGSEDELIDRMLKRAIIEGRDDDRPEIIKKRLEVYYKETIPVADEYNRRKQLVSVNGIGDIQDIAEKIDSIVAKVVEQKIR